MTGSTSRKTLGVGLTAGNVKIGSWGMYIKTDSVTADGAAASPIYSHAWYNESAPNWVANTDGSLEDAGQVFSVAATGTTEPLAFTTVTYPLVTSLAVKDTTTLAITDDTAIDGQATITLKYL